ncbi:MAG: hypothetical protein IT379_08025, partial [Deltaproteobacteria bacterium]|nr:hypothetical protein [Deltaproteobacteria bacterium]
IDAGLTDAGPLDLGPMDSGPLDTGPLDSGRLDSGPLDSGPLDSGRLDSGTSDAATSCVPGTTAGCASGTHCVLVFGEGDGGVAGAECVLGGSLIAGFNCNPDLPGCIPGFQCTENRSGAEVCMHICRTSADCGGPLRCFPAPAHGWADVDGTAYGVCLPPPMM